MLNSGRFWYTLAQKQGILTVKWSVTPATFSLAAMVKKKIIAKTQTANTQQRQTTVKHSFILSIVKGNEYSPFGEQQVL